MSFGIDETTKCMRCGKRIKLGPLGSHLCSSCEKKYGNFYMEYGYFPKKRRR